MRGSPKSPDVNVTSMGCMEYTCVPGIARRAGLTCGASCILNNHGHVGNFTGIWIFSSRYTYMGYRQSGMGIHGGRPTHPPYPRHTFLTLPQDLDHALLMLPSHAHMLCPASILVVEVESGEMVGCSRILWHGALQPLRPIQHG